MPEAFVRMPTRRPGVRWNAETISAALVQWHNEHGRLPNAKDWVRAGESHPSSQTVRRVFGGWDDALAAAAASDEALEARLGQDRASCDDESPRRMPTRRPGLRWTPELISYAIRIWYSRNNRLPSAQDWQRAGEDHPSHITVTRTFGEWSAALAYATASVEEQLAA